MKNFKVVDTPGASKYDCTWSVDPECLAIMNNPNGFQCVIEAQKAGFGRFYVTSENECGTSPVQNGWIRVKQGGGGMLMAWPNPANEFIYVGLSSGTLKQSSANKVKGIEVESSYEILIYDENYHIWFKTKTSEPQIQVDTRRFPKGIYYLHITYNGKTEKKQIVIE